MASTLKELVEKRIARMSSYIPESVDITDTWQDTVQGKLFTSSSDNSIIVSKLIPMIKKSKAELTITVIDTFLEQRAKKDYLHALKK